MAYLTIGLFLSLCRTYVCDFVDQRMLINDRCPSDNKRSYFSYLLLVLFTSNALNSAASILPSSLASVADQAW